MATTASGFWYPDEGTSFNINTIMSTAMSSVQAKVGPHVVDTGWVDCPLRAGTQQQGGSLPQVRRIGKVVYMRWGVSGSGKGATSTSSVCTVPSGFRPSDNWKYFTVASADARYPGKIVVKTSGDVELTVGSTASSYFIFDVAHWAID